MIIRAFPSRCTYIYILIIINNNNKYNACVHRTSLNILCHYGISYRWFILIHAQLAYRLNVNLTPDNNNYIMITYGVMTFFLSPKFKYSDRIVVSAHVFPRTIVYTYRLLALGNSNSARIYIIFERIGKINKYFYSLVITYNQLTIWTSAFIFMYKIFT